jgi:hypothetical protein
MLQLMMIVLIAKHLSPFLAMLVVAFVLGIALMIPLPVLLPSFENVVWRVVAIGTRNCIRYHFWKYIGALRRHNRYSAALGQGLRGGANVMGWFVGGFCEMPVK